LGGGTFDVSVLEVGDGVFQVKSTSGDTFLGGDDYDIRVMDYLIEEFKKQSGMDLQQDRQALQRLREAAEKAKTELSTVMETEINLPYLTADASGPKHLVMKLTRSKLEQLTNDLTEKSIGPVRNALKDAGLKPGEINEVVMVGGMTRMPIIQELIRREFSKEPHKGVNPDEVVAVGAAIQAGVLGGDVKDILLLDVTPLTLSIETLGAVATPLIERNTTIPTRKSQVFSTAGDNQNQVEINVLQGERPMAVDNKPRGVPQIEVTFDIDANGILNVTASDKATGRSQKITITASSGLSKEEIERMKVEAEQHSEEDEKRKDLIEAKNYADNAAYTAEKTLRENGEKIADDQKKKAEELVAKLRETAAGEDTDAIRKQTEELGQLIQQIGASLYQQEDAGQATDSTDEKAPGEDPTGGPDGEDVVDGEFKNV
jgi:molecular chaperone DnaK